MAGISISNIDNDGEGRVFRAHGHATLTDAGAVSAFKGTFEPGWRWSADVAPLAGTTSCQVRHLGFVLSGRMCVRLDDGTEHLLNPGDLCDIPAGHDAWVLGDEPCIMLDVSAEATRYATPGAAATEDRYAALVRRGYEAFNTGDLDALRTLMASDVTQHVPGDSMLAGSYKGIDAVLEYYGKLAEMTDFTFRANLIEVHTDGHGHATALHQISATRNGIKRVSRGSILFSFIGDKVHDLLEMRQDLVGDDAFMG